MDSRLKSFTESMSNIAFGYPINHIANTLIVVPLSFQIAQEASAHGALSPQVQMYVGLIGVLFTIVSVVRSYMLRRLFARFGEKENAYTLFVRLYRRIKGASA